MQDPTKPEQELEEPEEKGSFVCALTGRVRPRRERIQVGVAGGVRCHWRRRWVWRDERGESGAGGGCGGRGER